MTKDLTKCNCKTICGCDFGRPDYHACQPCPVYESDHDPASSYLNAVFAYGFLLAYLAAMAAVILAITSLTTSH